MTTPLHKALTTPGDLVFTKNTDSFSSMFEGLLPYRTHAVMHIFEHKAGEPHGSPLLKTSTAGGWVSMQRISIILGVNSYWRKQQLGTAQQPPQYVLQCTARTAHGTTG